VRFVLLALLTGCVAESTTPPGESHSIQFDWQGRRAPQVDVLFVVDDTAAMAPYRDKVLGLGPVAAWSFGAYPFGMPDLHVAVAKTSGTELSMITDVHNNDGSRRTSYEGELGSVLSTMLDVGSSSQQAPQPLATIERALAETDFIRPDTHLMTVTITANDDHSLDSVDHYVELLKARPREGLVTGVFPADAPRLQTFQSAFDPYHFGYSTTPDADNWSRTFAPLTNFTVDFIEECFWDPLPQPYECSVSMIDDLGHEEVLPPCDDTTTGACWQMVVDRSCISSAGVCTTIDVRGYARQFRPHLIGECVSQ
jgi:hypothetical protein